MREVKWVQISSDLLELLNKEWMSTSNVNAFLIANFIERHPVFQKKLSLKGASNTRNYVLKKSLYDRVINKIMTNCHTHTGKKLLAKKILDQVLITKSKQYSLSDTHLLILLLVKTAPNSLIRRLKFGSGHLTRVVRLTILKKISWFLCSLMEVLKTRKIKFSRKLGDQIDLIMSNSPKSKMLTLKREAQSQAEKANIQ